MAILFEWENFIIKHFIRIGYLRRSKVVPSNILLSLDAWVQKCIDFIILL